MKTKKGSALLLSTILLFVVLLMVVSLSYVTVMEQKMSQKTKSSVGSFFNADSGVEWALNKIASVSSDLAIGSSSAFNDSNIGDGVACPFGGCNVYFLDANGKAITDGNTNNISSIKAVRSVGTQNTGEVTQRAIEAAVAAGMDCQIVTNSCDVATCKADCPSGYKVIAGGWSGWLFNNIDENRPTDDKTGWLVTDAEHVSGHTNTIYATCCKY